MLVGGGGGKGTVKHKKGGEVTRAHGRPAGARHTNRAGWLWTGARGGEPAPPPPWSPPCGTPGHQYQLAPAKVTYKETGLVLYIQGAYGQAPQGGPHPPPEPRVTRSRHGRSGGRHRRHPHTHGAGEGGAGKGFSRPPPTRSLCARGAPPHPAALHRPMPTPAADSSCSPSPANAATPTKKKKEHERKSQTPQKSRYTHTSTHTHEHKNTETKQVQHTPRHHPHAHPSPALRIIGNGDGRQRQSISLDAGHRRPKPATQADGVGRTYLPTAAVSIPAGSSCTRATGLPASHVDFVMLKGVLAAPFLAAAGLSADRSASAHRLE